MPPKPFYETPKQIETAVNKYFATQDAGLPREEVTKQGKVVTIMKPQPYTRPGLALSLGFRSTQSLNDYAKKNDLFAEVLTRATTMIEDNRLRGILTKEQDAKAGWNDLACHHPGYVTKIQLPEGASILIGYTSPGPAIDNEGQPAKQLPPKPEQITD